MFDEKRLADLVWSNLRGVDAEHLSHILAEETLSFYAFKHAVDNILQELPANVNRRDFMEKSWNVMMLDSRQETFTRIVAGRLLHYLYGQLDDLLSSYECIDYETIGSFFLRALDETDDVFSGKTADPYFLHDYWRSDKLSPAKKYMVLKMYRSRSMNVAVERLQSHRPSEPLPGIEGQISKIYCRIYCAWPERSSIDINTDEMRFKLPSESSQVTVNKVDFIAQLIGAANPHNWEGVDLETFLKAAYSQKKGPRKELPSYNGLVIKFGDITEAIHTEFVRQYTRIPVPQIKMIFYSKGSSKLYIVMTEIQGTVLRKAFSSMTMESGMELFAQLKDYSAELSSVASAFPTTNRIGTLAGGPLSNGIFDPPPDRTLDGSEGFFRYWKARLENGYSRPEYCAKVVELIENAIEAPIIFSHGDLTPTNILVKEVGNDRYEIAGIIDWECSGFYPDFWEKMMASRGEMTYEWAEAIKDLWPSSSDELTRHSGDILLGALEFTYC